MDETGLINKIIDAVDLIISGRVELRTKGHAEEGRQHFHDGLAEATEVFNGVMTIADARLMLLAEYTFVAQEIASARSSETTALSSFTTALNDFDDAFRALEIVTDKDAYQKAEKTYPRNVKHRYQGFPKDAYHSAYISHRTRLLNTLKQIGIDPAEEELRKLRIDAIKHAQKAYMKLQNEILYKSDN